MKKIFTLSTLLLIACSGFAQTAANSEEYNELIRKSRRARTMSTIMVSTGPVIAAGGVGTLVYGLLKNEIDESEFYYDSNGNYVEVPPRKYTKEITFGAIAAAVGIAVAVSSIAFSNKAWSYKSQARKLKMKTAVDRFSIPGLQNGMAGYRITQYKFSLVVPLGR